MSRVRRVEDGPSPTAPPPALTGAAHPSRVAAERFLLRGDADAGAAAELHRVYAEQAAIWSEWAESQPDYLAPLHHALQQLPARPDAPTRRLTVEVAAGTGQATGSLAGSATTVLATDVLTEMVRQGAARVPTVAWAVADSARLPLPDRSVDLMVGCNAVFVLAEAVRVIVDTGTLLVVSSFAELTPIRHAPATLLDLLPGWSMTWARAGFGEWAMFRRDHGRAENGR